jgi:predicted phosphodiesterase
MPKSKPDLAVEMLKLHPQASKRRVAMLLVAKYPKLFSSVEAARSTVRAVTGAIGAYNRELVKTRLSDTSRKGSRRFACPPSKAKPWQPYQIDGKVVAIFSDCHFPKHDAAAIEAAVEHCQNWDRKIDCVILNGDFADAEEFSSWAKSPKVVDTENSLKTIREGLLYFCRSFPEAKIVYKFGNHEERLDRYCWSRAPELVGLEHISWKGLLTIDEKLDKVPELARVEFVGEQRPLMVGKLPVFHGHELPKGLVNAVNPARGAFLRMIESVIIGHHHRSSSHVEYNWKHEPINCWSVACLCDLTPEYARINKWNLGHAIIEVKLDNDFSVHNFKQLAGNKIVTA